MKKKLSVLFLGLFMFLFITPAQSSIIFDGGTPNQINGNEMAQWVQTEDFMLRSDTLLTDVHIWTVEGGSWDGTLDYFIFADAGGVPGAAPLYSGSAKNIVKTATGNSLSFGSEFAYDFDVQTPILLSGGVTYWLGLHASSNWDRDEIYWETTNTTIGSKGVESDQGTFNNWFNNGQYHAFNLTGGTTVPEPATMILFGIGLLGLAGVSRKQK